MTSSRIPTAVPARIAFAAIAAAYWLTLWLPSLPGTWLLKVTPMLIAAWTIARVLSPSAALPLTIGFVAAAFGDFFLAFNRPEFFFYGLGSFLITQIAYSTAFFGHGQNTLARWPWWLPVVFFGAAVFAWMRPSLGQVLWPVALYVTALTIMAIAASGVGPRPGRIFLGALLFVASDSLIGIERFVADFPFSLQAIIATYMIAQYLIFTGALERLPRRSGDLRS